MVGQSNDLQLDYLNTHVQLDGQFRAGSLTFLRDVMAWLGSIDLQILNVNL